MALPIMAQEQEWKSTSAMPTSGSAYTPQVNAVGATGVSEMATTTSSPQNSGPSKAKKWDEGAVLPETPNDGPLGDAVLPLLFMSLAFGMFVYFRRKRSEA